MKEISLKLCRPKVSDQKSFLAGFDELVEASDRSSWIYMGDGYPLDPHKDNFEFYVAALLNRAHSPPQGFVKDTMYWAKVGDEVVGRIAIRHELNEFLSKIGGHIGYIVRPSWRGKGVATEMLRQLLMTKEAQLIKKLLLTCDEANVASEKTILKNGGRFESIIENGVGRPKKKRFWIDLSEQ